MNENIVSVLNQFSRYNFEALFTVNLRKYFEDIPKYLRFVYQLLEPLEQQKFSKEQLSTTGVIDYWLEISMKSYDDFIIVEGKEIVM